MESNNGQKILDIEKIIRTLWKKRMTFFKVIPVVAIVSYLWILPAPRYYNCDVKLAPEMGGEDLVGGLSSIASSFGFDFGGMSGADAIYPVLYPDLFESPEFLVQLMEIRVSTLDRRVQDVDYYTYLTRHQKKNWLKAPFIRAQDWVQDLFAGGDGRKVSVQGKLNPFLLSKKDYDWMMLLKTNIKCSVDKKTNVTTIVITDQDPLVCAIMADSVKSRLQGFITKYRTSKACQDVEYYQHLSDSAYAEYKQAMRAYSIYCDSHKDAILQTHLTERDNLENDMSTKYSTYTAMYTQLQAMKAKVQERTPSFTTLKSASVPVKPAGPKRMFFALGMSLFAAVLLALWVLRKELS